MDKITKWVCDKIFTQKKKRDMWQDDSLYKLFIVFLEEQQIRTYKTKLTTKKKIKNKNNNWLNLTSVICIFA